MRNATCRYCGHEGRWVWDYYKKKSVLFNKEHGAHRCSSRDIFPGWCTQCKQPDLLLIRKDHKFQLIENYGLPHTCTENGETDIWDMSEAKCKHCSTSGLFWVQTGAGRFSLLAPTGVKHTCSQYDTYQKMWAEAKRMDYAFEKVWINSKADYAECKRCKGQGQRRVESRNKRLMQKYSSSEPIVVYRPCRHCRCLGRFSPDRKKMYLKNLRRKYWPFRSDIHKWKKKYDD